MDHRHQVQTVRNIQDTDASSEDAEETARPKQIPNILLQIRTSLPPFPHRLFVYIVSCMALPVFCTMLDFFYAVQTNDWSKWTIRRLRHCVPIAGLSACSVLMVWMMFECLLHIDYVYDWLPVIPRVVHGFRANFGDLLHYLAEIIDVPEDEGADKVRKLQLSSTWIRTTHTQAGVSESCRTLRAARWRSGRGGRQPNR